MAVITVSREIGSLGADIAVRTAEKLGYTYVDKDLIQKIMNQYGVIQFQDLYDAQFGIWDQFDHSTDAIYLLLNKIIYSIARINNMVILGRGSYAILQGFSNVLNVKIQAPFEQRVATIMQEEGISDRNQAEKLLTRLHKSRKAFIEHTYHSKWDRASNFDLVFDTSHLSVDSIIAYLCQAAAYIDSTVNELTGRTVASIPEDSVLDNAVKDILNRYAGRTV